MTAISHFRAYLAQAAIPSPSSLGEDEEGGSGGAGCGVVNETN